MTREQFLNMTVGEIAEVARAEGISPADYYNQHANKGICPEWCVEVHDEINPVSEGFHAGEPDPRIEQVWDRTIGTEGSTADGFLRVMTLEGIPYLSLSLEVCDELRRDEVEAAAQQYERLAQLLRDSAHKLAV